MQLYTVHYTLAHSVTKYDSRGKPIDSYVDDIPHTLTALPHSTALQYKNCKNFRMEPYTPDARRPITAQKSTADYRGTRAVSKSKTVKASSSSVRSAAASGDLAAAINAGAK